VNMHTGRQSKSQLRLWREDVKTRSGVDESDDDDEEELQGKHEHGKSAGVSWELSTTYNRSRASRAIVFCRGELVHAFKVGADSPGVADNLASSLDSLVLDTVRRALAVKVYYPTSRSQLSGEYCAGDKLHCRIMMLQSSKRLFLFWRTGKEA